MNNPGKIISDILKFPVKLIGWAILLFVALLVYLFVFIFSITLSGNVVTPWHFFSMVIHDETI